MISQYVNGTMNGDVVKIAGRKVRFRKTVLTVKEQAGLHKIKRNTMPLIPKSFTVDEDVYLEFRKSCDKKAVSVSKWLRNCMNKQMEKWGE